MCKEDDQLIRAVANGIEHEQRARATGAGVGVIVFLAAAALVIFLGLQLNWGGWAGLWALIAATIAGGEASSYTKKRALP